MSRGNGDSPASSGEAIRKPGVTAEDRYFNRSAAIRKQVGAALGLAQAAGPALERLRDKTGESVQLFVAEGGRRVCIVSLESPHSLRTMVAVGASLPMDKGSAGRALSGAPDVLARGWTESVEERELGVASVSAPVYLDGAVVAALSVSGPIERTTRSPGELYASLVVEAARDVSASLR